MPGLGRKYLSKRYGQFPRRLSSKHQAEKAQVDLTEGERTSNLILSLFLRLPESI